MATLDAGALLAEISAELPCGEDVEYDPAFLELERVVHGKPDAQYGDTIVEAVPPDWKQAEALALGLFEKNRDLRVATFLCRALLNRSGFVAFADGLRVVEGLLDQRWDHVYPLLDTDDDNDPTARVNALSALTEQGGTLADVRDAALASSRTHGIVTLRDIEYATGEVAPPSGVEPPQPSSIEAVIADARDDARATHEALTAALQSTTRIESLLTDRVGASRALDLAPLARLLRHAAEFIGERVRDSAQEHESEPDTQDGAPEAAAGGMPPARAPGTIATRRDVVEALDRICAYYEKNEPSSPVPLLLQRARRLVDRSFIEILQDLAPEGLSQARFVGGIESE
jgi:type VI secretion system protein ImpA